MANSVTANVPASIARRHDLDALRAVAMLLGIGLHGAMSFIPFAGAFWAVQDTQTNEMFGFPIGLAVESQGEGVGRGLSVLCQVAYAWLVAFGMMGLFRWWLSSENKTMRYLSDSSYWLYLAHIPLIIYVQYCVRDWSASPFIKFLLVCFVTSGLLLSSYQLFVRYTPIGTLLNGPRRRVPKSEEPVDAVVPEMDRVGADSSLRAEPVDAGHSTIQRK